MTDTPQPKLAEAWRRSRAWWMEGALLSIGILLAGLFLADFHNPPDLLRFIGRFHPVIVHFPIGLLLLAGILEIFAIARSFRHLREASAFVLAVGAASAVAAVVAGYLLSLEGGYDEALVASHKRLGIAVAVGAIVACYLRARGRRRDSRLLEQAYAGVLLATVGALMLAGNRGGELTHGSGYFTHYLPAPLKGLVGVAEARAARSDITNIDSAYVYGDLVAPVLEARCVSCHSGTKEKGGLRLDTAEGLLKGGNSGSPVVPGSPEESDLYRRITLPLDHEDVMPANGAAPLGIGETELIRWWILNGAPMESRVAEMEEVPPSVATLFRRIAPPREEVRTGVYAVEVQPAAAGAIAALKRAGFEVDPIAGDVLLLRVSAVNRRSSVTDEELTGLLPIAEQIGWLDLGRSQIGDAGLAVVGRMPHLLRLHLDQTRVSDAGLRNLEALEKLEYLNLYGTGVSDDGVPHLERLVGLKALYLWQTQVTEVGADRLRERLPATEVVLGISSES